MVKEKWKPIKGYENIYEVSNYGRVKRLSGIVLRNTSNKQKKIKWKGRIMKPFVSNTGYFRLELKNHGAKKFSIHRLVAEAFILNPLKKREVNHINFNRKDNRVENLEWTTSSENNYHACRNNRRPSRKGEKHPLAKLTDKDVNIIIKLCKKNNLKRTDIAKMFNVTTSVITGIKSGRSWTHITNSSFLWIGAFTITGGILLVSFLLV